MNLSIIVQVRYMAQDKHRRNWGVYPQSLPDLKTKLIIFLLNMKKPIIVPFRDVILLKRENETTTSGLVLPSKSINIGTVIATGDGKYADGCLNPMSVREGDKVIFEGEGIEYHDYILLKEEQILASI